MPTAFDQRRQNVSDHDPLRNLLDFESINDTAKQAGNPVADLLNGFGSGIANALQAGADIIQNITNTFLGILVDNPITDLINSILGIMGIGQTAQTSSDTANTGVAIISARLDSIMSSGVYFSDTFDRGGAGLGSNYTERSFGSGAGGWATNGYDLYWAPNGAVAKASHGRRNTELSTDYQAGQILVGPPSGGSTESTEDRILLRQNAAQTDYIMASLITALSGADLVTSAEIGYTVADVYTRLGASESVVFAEGDRWELRTGIKDPVTLVVDDYRFQLYRNDSLVIDRTDAAMASQIGASHRGAGPGMRAGVSLFFAFLQVAATPMHIFAAADRIP